MLITKKRKPQPENWQQLKQIFSLFFVMISKLTKPTISLCDNFRCAKDSCHRWSNHHDMSPFFISGRNCIAFHPWITTAAELALLKGDWGRCHQQAVCAYTGPACKEYYVMLFYASIPFCLYEIKATANNFSKLSKPPHKVIAISLLSLASSLDNETRPVVFTQNGSIKYLP